MSSSRPPSAANTPDSLPREIADQVLARAIELQHEWGEIIPTDTIRSTAAEVGIDPRYVEMALGEIGTMRPAGAQRAPSSGMGRAFGLAAMLAIGVWLGSAMSGRGDSAPAPARQASGAGEAATAEAPAQAAAEGAGAASAPAPAIPANAEAILKAHCEQEWGTDFPMRRYCEDQQRGGIKDLVRMDREHGGMPQDTYNEVRERCRREWDDDFMMIAHCVDQQADAYEELNS
jgi:hypothetical protein